MLAEMETKRKEKLDVICITTSMLSVLQSKSKISIKEKAPSILWVSYSLQPPQGPHQPNRQREFFDRSVKAGRGGVVLNDDCTKSPVVHQWNRCWDQLVAFVCNEKTCLPDE